MDQAKRPAIKSWQKVVAARLHMVRAKSFDAAVAYQKALKEHKEATELTLVK